MEQEQTCGVGSALPQPCPHPAVAMLYGQTPTCEGHKALYALASRTDELRVSLTYLKRWIRTAERCPDAESLKERLAIIRDEFAAELAGLDAKAREISERYSLPPEGPEQLEAKRRSKEDTHEPGSEAERRRMELDARSRRFTAAAYGLEDEIERLHARLENLVLPLLDDEAERADEEAARVKAEFGL